MRLGPDRVISLLIGAGTVAFIAAVLAIGESSPLAPRPVLLQLPAVGLFIVGAVAVAGWAILLRGTGSATIPEDAWNRVAIHTLIALLAAGFALRLAHLWNYAYSNDEVLFVFASGHASLAASIRDSLNHFHPPTNFILLHYLLKVSWDPVWVRLPAVVGGTLAIPLTFLFVRSFLGSLAGLVAAFLTTFSPSLILLSQVCRNYSPSLPFFLLSLYFLSKFIRDGALRSLYGFALFEMISVMWHYALLPAFLGANLVLLGFILRSGKGGKVMLQAVAAQLPVALIYAAALFLHRPLTMAGQQERVVQFMVDEFNFDPRNPMKQIVDLFQFLLAPAPGAIHFAMAVGFIILAGHGAIECRRRGQSWHLGLCLLFLPFSFLFAFVLKSLPFGGTRHSFYAYPFLFAVIAAGLVRLAAFGDGQAGGRAAMEAQERRHSASRAPAWRGILGIAAMGGYLFLSLQSYADVTPYYLRASPAYHEARAYYRPQFYKVEELPTREQDIRDLCSALLNFSEPGELVLCSLPVFMILNAALGDPPQDISFDMSREYRFEWNDRSILYVPGASLGFTPNPLLLTVAAEAQGRDMTASDRVWIGAVGWEAWAYTAFEWTEVMYPEILARKEAWDASRGTLFAVKVGPVMSRMHGFLDLAAHPPIPGILRSGLRDDGSVAPDGR